MNFVDPSYYSFYVGTQKGKEEVKYQRLSDIRSKQDPNWTATNIEFEIEKTDFLYLVYEEYDGKSDVFKYEIPKDVSEITITYELAVLGDLKIFGFLIKTQTS